MIYLDLLKSISSHNDLLQLNEAQRVELCRQIREFLVDRVSKTGGHLASNLGVVELSVALETVYNTEFDRLVFDVGHQSYVHKLLTGRQAEFENLRQFGGMAGFPKPGESVTDAFVAGHASSSVSIALGMARARTLQHHSYDVVCVLGDGAATGGMAYEGLNDAADSKEPMVIILNDNAMSINENVGGLARHLSRLRTKESYLGMKKRYRNALSKNAFGRFIYRTTRTMKDWIKRMIIPTTIFENMGLAYLGPVDGADVNALVNILGMAKQMGKPVLVHVLTKKGRGYAPAERDPSKFHGLSKFDPATGETNSKKQETFSDRFGTTMVELAETEPKLCAVTAAMPMGTGLMPFVQAYPERTFDVGIAEEHAVSMAAGLAKQGMKPVVAIYSTFLQRAYDQILQDICLLQLPVVFAVDRAGLVGEDGETHHGVFDVGFLRHAPGMKLLCPASLAEQKAMLTWAVKAADGPVAIRYPRGGDGVYGLNEFIPGKTLCCHATGRDVVLLTYGTMLNNVMVAVRLLERKGIHATVLRLTVLSGFCAEEIFFRMNGCRKLIVVEETVSSCSIAPEIANQLHKLDMRIKVDALNLGGGFATHGSMDKLYAHYGLDGASIAAYVEEGRRNEN